MEVVRGARPLKAGKRQSPQTPVCGPAPLSLSLSLPLTRQAPPGRYPAPSFLLGKQRTQPEHPAQGLPPHCAWL